MRKDKKLKRKHVLVTGAGGFVGSALVKRLAANGYSVKAGIHNPADTDDFERIENVEPVILDILDKESLCEAMHELDEVYHFAALVNSKASQEELFRVNVEGTRNVWECAAQQRVKKALYCSSTAVYGLLVGSQQPISEEVTPCAVEPYGRSKYKGEVVAIEIGKKLNLPTTVIRPTAVFGPRQNTSFGKTLLNAAFSKLLLPGGFEKKAFNFVHVDDLAEAALHIMGLNNSNGQIFNIAVDRAISFEEAFGAYHLALKRIRYPTFRLKLIALLSGMLHKNRPLAQWISKLGGKHMVFNIWQPGFDITYSAQRLLATSFKFKWSKFEDVLVSCIESR